jgi:hypothetical protein
MCIDQVMGISHDDFGFEFQVAMIETSNRHVETMISDRFGSQAFHLPRSNRHVDIRYVSIDVVITVFWPFIEICGVVTNYRFLVRIWRV